YRLEHVASEGGKGVEPRVAPLQFENHGFEGREGDHHGVTGPGANTRTEIPLHEGFESGILNAGEINHILAAIFVLGVVSRDPADVDAILCPFGIHILSQRNRPGVETVGAPSDHDTFDAQAPYPGG